MNSRLLLILLSALPLFQINSQVLDQDSLALVAVYSATNGDTWTNNTGWLDGPVSTWYGVVISEGRVIRLQLWSNNLTGTLPQEVGDLNALQHLDIDDNSIEGTLPTSVGNCTELEMLDISVNNFSGSFPEQLENCTKLHTIIAYRNELSGPFPEVLLRLPAIERIEINSNAFTGSIPPAIDTLSKITTFAVSRNQFSGPMPSIQNMTSIVSLHIHENLLEGMLDTIFGYHPDLYYCTINHNNFSGCVAETHFNPEKLQYLHVQSNQFDCLGDFSSFITDGVLQRLYASNNRFDFDDLEKNLGAGTFSYSPQDSTLSPETRVMQEGDSITIYIGAGGTFPTTYTWFKDDLLISGEAGPSLHIGNFTDDDYGAYFGKALNDSLPDLVLSRHQVHLVEVLPSSQRTLELDILEIYPNPCSDRFFIDGISGQGSLQIFDMQGHQVMVYPAHDLSRPVRVEDLFRGSYTIRLHVEGVGGDYVGKFIKL